MSDRTANMRAAKGPLSRKVDNLRLGTITLIPSSRVFIARERTIRVPQLQLEELAQVLFLLRGPPEVAMRGIVLYSVFETARSIFRTLFAIYLEGTEQGVGSFVWLVEFLSLDGCCCFKCLARLKI